MIILRLAIYGVKIYTSICNLYTENRLYTVLFFFSKNYLKKSWTRHELKQAQARAFPDNREYILPVIMDVELSAMPGMNITTGYIDYNNFSAEQIVDLIINKIDASHKLQQTNFFQVKFKKTVTNVLFGDILFIDSISPLVYIHTENNKYKTYDKLSSVLLSLPNNFIRIHNSIIVNQDRIEFVCSEFVQLTNGQVLPISRPYKKYIKNIFDI